PASAPRASTPPRPPSTSMHSRTARLELWRRFVATQKRTAELAGYDPSLVPRMRWGLRPFLARTGQWFGQAQRCSFAPRVKLRCGLAQEFPHWAGRAHPERPDWNFLLR